MGNRRRPSREFARERLAGVWLFPGHLVLSRNHGPTEEMLAHVRSAWPGLVPNGAEVRASRGQFNDVLIVGEAFVFRFPRSAEAARTLRAEVALLRALQGRLPLPVPNPEFVRIGPSAEDQVLMGYRLLPGQPLTREIVAGLSRSDVREIAGQIGNFLRDLHGIPATALPPSRPIDDRPADWASLLASFEAELFPHMRPEASSTVAASFGGFLAAAGPSDFTPVLRHGDLGGENIRFDPATNRVTGVIDFGSAGLGDPAVDLAGLSWYGDEFIETLCRPYPALADPTVRSRAEFYRSTHALQQALWAIRAGEIAEFEDGIAGYR